MMTAHTMGLMSIPEDRAMSFNSAYQQMPILEENACEPFDLDLIIIIMSILFVGTVIGMILISIWFGMLSVIILAFLSIHILSKPIGKSKVIIEVTHDTYTIIDIQPSRLVHL